MTQDTGSSPRIAVMDTGVANIASMLAALTRQDTQPFLTQSPDEVIAASHAVLPGVGAFGAGMARLHELGLADAIAQRFNQDQPTLCVCLGLQLLCTQSEETPGVQGLGLIDARIRKLGSITQDNDLRVPQLGWNHVEPQGDTRYLTEAGHAYYANSYRLSEAPEGWVCATTEYGERFIAAIERGRWLACQFHPELSSTWGADLISRWIKGA